MVIWKNDFRNGTKFLKGCLPQISPGPFLNTLSQIFLKKNFKFVQQNVLSNKSLNLKTYGTILPTFGEIYLMLIRLEKRIATKHKTWLDNRGKNG